MRVWEPLSSAWRRQPPPFCVTLSSSPTLLPWVSVPVCREEKQASAFAVLFYGMVCVKLRWTEHLTGSRSAHTSLRTSHDPHLILTKSVIQRLCFCASILQVKVWKLRLLEPRGPLCHRAGTQVPTGSRLSVDWLPRCSARVCFVKLIKQCLLLLF